MTTMMLSRDIQLANEYTYSRKHIDGYIRQEIEDNIVMMGRLREGVARLEHWREKDYYASKNARLAQLQELDLTELVMDVFIHVSYCQTPELFTSVTGQLAGRLKFSDRAEGITTIGEILAVLCMTDAFDIYKEDAMASLMVFSRIPLSHRLLGYIHQSAYLPPMVCPPDELTHNRQSGYLTHNDSVILGSSNHHENDVCLDALNIQNSVTLRLDTDFLSTVEEEPTFEIDSVDKLRSWTNFKCQSYDFYLMIAKQSKENGIHLTHKYDKRGRMYSQGYHINTQATAFKKAALEFHKEELIEGVPGQ